MVWLSIRLNKFSICVGISQGEHITMLFSQISVGMVYVTHNRIDRL